MKELSKRVILFVLGFTLGFGFQSVLATTFSRARMSVFLAEAGGQVLGLRQKVSAFRRTHGRPPRDVAEMVAQGFWPVTRPPMELLQGSADWVTVYDGQGGFVYLTRTGQVYLNTDLTREYLTLSDIHKLTTGGLVPPGAFY